MIGIDCKGSCKSNYHTITMARYTFSKNSSYDTYFNCITLFMWNCLFTLKSVVYREKLNLYFSIPRLNIKLQGSIVR